MSISWDDLIRDAGDAITSFEPIPDGDYDMEVVELKPEMTKDGSKKKFSLKAKIVGGAHGNRFIWDNIVLTTDNPNALGFFFKKMAGIGLTIDFFKTKPSDEQIAATAKGRRFRAKIGSRVWNGEKKNEIKNYYPSQPAGNQPPGMSGAGAPPPPAPAPQAAPPPPPAPAPAPAPQVQEQQPAYAPPATEQQPQYAPVAQQDPWTGQPAYQPPAQQPQMQTTSGYPQAPQPTPAAAPQYAPENREQGTSASAPPPPPQPPMAQPQDSGPAAPPPPPPAPF